MTKRIFRSIWFATLAALLAALGLVMGIMYRHMTQVQTAQLRVETSLAAHAVANEGLQYFGTLEGTADCRITWIAADGTVLYDNRSDSGAMQSHLEREEVIEALRSGYGESTRYSDTLLERFIYCAQLLPDGTVLRLSTAQSTIFTLMLDMVPPVLAVIVIAMLLSLLLANRLAQSIVRPLNELDLDTPLSNGGYEEIRPLLRRLDSQQQQLRIQERELAQHQKEFSTVTRALNEGLVLLSSGGTILSINPAGAQLLEVTPNCAGADFAVANTNPAIAALVEQAFAGTKAEQVMQLHGGTYLAAARPVRSGGAVSGVALLLFDVTQQKKAEELRREFTANVSHELKTPLHAISGYAELMKSGMAAPGDMPGFAEKIYAEAQRMVSLVEDTLRLSRLDEGAADLQAGPVDLYAAAQAAVSELAAPAELKDVALTLAGESTVIRAVPALVSSILFNLTDNAVKYNRPGGSVSVRIQSQPGWAVVTVADTGIGIPEEHRERIFERFYRVDKSHSKQAGGTGLGLSIVKHAAQILGAELSLSSTVGTGTTITVRFPK